jgi:hypothetical protein
MEPFDVCLNMRVIAGSEEVWFHRWIELPFAPFTGLQIWLGAGELDWDRTATVESVVWDANEKNFQLTLGDFATPETDSRPISSWIAEFQEAGWEVTASA